MRIHKIGGVYVDLDSVSAVDELTIIFGMSDYRVSTRLHLKLHAEPLEIRWFVTDAEDRAAQNVWKERGARGRYTAEDCAQFVGRARADFESFFTAWKEGPKP